MAMNIISKEKKEIKWIGLPTNSAQECQNLEVRCLKWASFVLGHLRGLCQVAELMSWGPFSFISHRCQADFTYGFGAESLILNPCSWVLVVVGVVVWW